MSTPFLFILMSLTAYRITWFITKDSFPWMRSIREFCLAKQSKESIIVRIDGEGHQDSHGEYQEYRGKWEWPAVLLTCFWCMSVWVSGGLTWAMSHYLIYDWLWFGGVAATSATLCQLVYKKLVE